MVLKQLRRAAIGAAAVGGLRAAREIAGERADRRFMQVDPARESVHEVGPLRFRLPAAFHRTDGFVAYHTADLEAVRALLPAGLYPVQADRMHGLVGVAAYRHFDVTARATDGSTMPFPPYGEVAVIVPVTRRRMPPLVPILLEWAVDRPMAAFVLSLPVTSRLARDIGRSVWGLPKFVADMEFYEDGLSRRVHVGETGRTMLDIEVRVSGSARHSRAPGILYSVLDGRLHETVMASRTFVQRALRPRGELRLGDHPEADRLAGLDIAEKPFAAGIVVSQRFLAPAGLDRGPADAPPVHAGADRDLGAFTTRSADGMVVNHNAGATRAGRTPVTSWDAEVMGR